MFHRISRFCPILDQEVRIFIFESDVEILIARFFHKKVMVNSFLVSFAGAQTSTS